MASMNEIVVWLPMVFATPVAVILGIMIGIMIGGDE